MKQKLNNIRTQLRRQRLQQQFEFQRNLLTLRDEKYYCMFEDTLQKMQTSMKQTNLQECCIGFNRLIQIAQQKSQASSYVFIHCQKISEIINFVTGYKNLKESQEQILMLLLDKHINTILQFLTIINYNFINYNSFERVFKSFVKILYYQLINFQSLTKALIVVDRMMNPPNQIVFACLKNYKFSVKLCEIVKLSRANQIDHKVQNIFLETISLLLQNQYAFNQSTGFYYKQNKFFLQYCLKGLKQIFSTINWSLSSNSAKKTLWLYLAAIRHLLKFDVDFVNMIKIQELKLLIQLMSSNIRKVQVNVIQIINILLCQDSSFCDILVEKFRFIQLIEKKLRKQLYFRDDDTTNFVEKCTLIMCNITNVRDKKLKLKIYQQPVWLFMLTNISNFIVFVEVFSFYFQLVPRNQLLKNILPYLEAIVGLDFENLLPMYKQAISFNIQRLYNRVEMQFPDQALHKFLQKIQQQKYLQRYLSQQMQDKVNNREDLL